MRRVCSELSSLPESARSVKFGGHSDPSVEGVCGDGVVVSRVSVGEGGRCGAMVLVLPPRCLLVARAPLRGSGASIGVVSVGYSCGAAGGFEGAQLLGLGPRSSPGSCHWGSLFVVNVI